MPLNTTPAIRRAVRLNNLRAMRKYLDETIKKLQKAKGDEADDASCGGFLSALVNTVDTIREGQLPEALSSQFGQVGREDAIVGFILSHDNG